MSSQEEKAKKAIEPRFVSRRTLGALIRLIGAPVSREKDNTTIELMASLQKRLGLGADGVFGEGQSLPAIFRSLKQIQEFELLAWIIAGMYNMWENDVTQLSYEPRQTRPVRVWDQAEGVKFVVLGPQAFTGGFETLARALAPAISPLKVFSGPSIAPNGDKILWLDAAFHPSMKKVSDFCVQHDVSLIVTSVFRAEGAAVGGAIVSPAQFSNHKAGHAIDMNIFVKVNGQKTLFNSAKLNPRNESGWPQSLKNFINALRTDPGLRWGGDFNTTDPVHIDDGLNLTRNQNSNFLQRYIATQSAARFGATDVPVARSMIVPRGLETIDVEDVSCEH